MTDKSRWCEFSEYVGHETVGSRHEIVEDEETGFIAVEDGVRLCRQTVAETDISIVVAGDVRQISVTTRCNSTISALSEVGAVRRRSA